MTERIPPATTTRPGLRVRILPDADAVAHEAAAIAAEHLRARPDGTLGLATGSSPEGMYAVLAEQIAAGELDVSGWRAFALDEYVGLEAGDPNAYIEVLRRQVEGPFRMRPGTVQAQDSAAVMAGTDPEEVCAAYEQAIREAGGIDLQMLGIGANSHIGFNEPGSPFDSRTRLQQLTGTTRQDNARFFASIDEVPERCLTQGIGTILEARALLLIAVGENKADAVAAMLEGPVTTEVPASALREHPNVTVVLDEAAASKLTAR